MTSQEAQTFGRTKTLKATGLIVILLLVVFIFMQTSGDFANGILFFIQAISDIHFLIILTILFGLTYLFGGKAGKEIIIEKKSIMLTSIKYALLIILTIIIYAATVGIAMDKTSSVNNLQRLVTKYFLIPLANTGSLTIIPMLVIWLWATNQMKMAERQKTE